MLAVCLSMYTTTTHRLCCSGSAAGIVFGTFYPSVVCMLILNTDPVLGVTDANITLQQYNTATIITSTTMRLML